MGLRDRLARLTLLMQMMFGLSVLAVAGQIACWSALSSVVEQAQSLADQLEFITR